MLKLLSTTAFAAMLAIGGAAYAQSGASGNAGGAGQGPEGQPRGNTATGVPLSGTTGPSTVGKQTGPMMSEEKVRDMLSKQDFHNVENVTRDGNTWHARAMQSGRPVTLSIDANTGAITSNTAAR